MPLVIAEQDAFAAQYLVCHLCSRRRFLRRFKITLGGVVVGGNINTTKSKDDCNCVYCTEHFLSLQEANEHCESLENGCHEERPQ